MKSLFVPAMAGLLCAGNALAQAQAVFQNNSDLTFNSVPPQVAATAFINSALFQVDTLELPFDTLYTLYFTNKTSGRMEGYPGFRLDFSTNSSSATITRYPAATIHNQGKIYGSTWVDLWASNIYSPGPISVGAGGLLRMVGNNVDLSRSFLRAGGDPEYPEVSLGLGIGIANAYINPRGVTDRYWGVGVDGTLSGSNGAALNLPFLRLLRFETPSPSSPSHQTLELSPFGRNRILTNFNQLPGFLSGSSGQYDAYAVSNILSSTSALIQVVFIPTNNSTLASGIATQVRFLGGVFGGFGATAPAIEFRSSFYDPLEQVSRQQTFYLVDYSAQLTNYTLQTAYDPVSLTPLGTRRPNAFETSLEPPLLWNFSGGPNLAYSNVVFYNTNFLTNVSHYAYAAYSALLNATNDFFGPIYILPQDPTNTTGRVEISAETLDLRQARIHAENYVSITASNLLGNTLAAVDAPIIRYDIGTTQSVLRISNLVASVFNRMYGQISVWSAVWTNYATNVNFFTGNVETNQLRYHVMFVDFQMQPTVPVQLFEFTGRATNVVVDDNLGATRSLVVDAESLWVTTRGVTNASLTLPATNGWGPANFPRLKYLTNEGLINVPLAADFSTRLETNDVFGQPVWLEVPYRHFINHGTISAATHSVYATNFLNTGSLVAFSGAIQLRLTNGTLAGGQLSARSDVEVRARDFSAAASTLSAGGYLLLDVTNRLTDAGPAALNDWSVGDGVVMLRRPASGDLLGTRIVSHAGFNQLVRHVWAGQNRGATPAGFSNNAAVGHLVLDGGELSLFQFAGAGTNDALYVDYLEFRNNATNIAATLQIAPNLTIYFANANLSADKLNGALGGRLRWVYQYTGAFSSTNLLLDGQVVTLNAALMQSMFSDLDADGIPNKIDPSPLFSGRDMDLRVELDRSPAWQTRISWYAIRQSTSYVEYSTNLISGPWLPLTTLTQGAANGRLFVVDPVRPEAPRYYRVRLVPVISLIQP